MPGATDKPMPPPPPATLPLIRRRDWETASSLRARTVDLPANAPLVIPVSQLADGAEHNFERGDEGVTVSVTEWIAKQKGLES